MLFGHCAAPPFRANDATSGQGILNPSSLQLDCGGAKPLPSSLSKFVGRARTRDRKTPSPHPSLAEQEQSWLRSSCLNSQDFPGKLVSQKSERCIEFFDVVRKRISVADMVRR